MHGIVIAFPGTGYNCKEKLFEDCIEKYTSLGYDIVRLDFSNIPYKEIKILEEAIEKTKPVILDQLKEVIFEEYEDIIFISKSLGTVCANWTEEYFNIRSRQLYLTPLKQALETINTTSRTMGMVIGKEDKHLDYKLMESFCLERNIPYLICNDVGHNLKIDGDELKTQEINTRITKFCLIK